MQKSEKSSIVSGSGKFLICCLFLLLQAALLPSEVLCQSTAVAPGPGDIIFTQVGSSDPDRFEFVTLKRLNLTSMQITDNAFLPDMSFASSEGTIYLDGPEYNCLSDVPGGTFVRFVRSSGINETDLSDKIVTFYYSEFVSLNNSSGDQLIAFLGNPFSPTVIASVDFGNGGWLTSGGTNSNTSYCPGTISDIYLGLQNNYRFNGTVNGDANTTRNCVKNTSNWEGSGSVLDFTLKDIGNTYLPVELTSFDAEIIDESKVLLKWTTASEINNYGWDIEKKQNQTEWIKTGFVSGRGNSNTPFCYSFIDNSPFSGKEIFYRLKQIDFDGYTAKYSDEVKIKVPQVRTLLALQNYPNPFNNSTVITYSLADEEAVSLKIFDILGNLIASLIDEKQSAGSHSFRLDSSRLNGNYTLGSGVYLFKLQAGSSSLVKKFVILK